MWENIQLELADANLDSRKFISLFLAAPRFALFDLRIPWIVFVELVLVSTDEFLLSFISNDVFQHYSFLKSCCQFCTHT